MSNLFSDSDSFNNSTSVATAKEAKQFLKFALYPSTKLMLPIRQITEVLKIRFGQIVPIPQMPPWVMGVYNWRGDILWMVDLGHLIGCDPWYQRENHSSYYTGIVLSPGKEETTAERKTEINLGLVVSRVEDIQMCDVSAIQSPRAKNNTTQLDPFLQGYWPEEEEMILVLDGKAIVAAMPKKSH